VSSFQVSATKDYFAMTDFINSMQGPDRGFPEVRSGDTVKVHLRIVEGNRERVQIFQGVVIRHRGGGQSENFTVRRIAHGVGVERTFLMRSPRIDKIEVLRNAKVRRAQLYYMRGLTGKAARLKERRIERPGIVTPDTLPEVPTIDSSASEE